MWQGGLGQVIKQLKCYLPPEPSCPFPAAGSPGAELSELLLLRLPSTYSGKMMLKAAACSLHPQAGGTEGLAGCGGCGKARSLSSEQPRVFAHHFIRDKLSNNFLCKQ